VGPTKPTRALKLVLVGEAPGRVEEKLGAPFLGQSGKLVNTLLQKEARVPRSDVYLTNAALCRGESDRENEAAARYCAPRLLKELGQMPKVPIAPLGKSAVKSILGLTKILLVRGFIWELPKIEIEPIKAQKAEKSDALRRAESLKRRTIGLRGALAGRHVLPSIHPAFVLRSEVWHAIIRADFRRIGRFCRGEVRGLADRGSHVVSSDPKALYQLGPRVALDVETTKEVSPLLARLLCVGVADEKMAVVLWPWQARMAKPLTKFLRSRREVVGHNLIGFDRVVLAEASVK